MSFAVRKIGKKQRKLRDYLLPAGKVGIALVGPMLTLLRIAQDHKSSQRRELLLKRIFTVSLVILLLCAIGVGTVQALLKLRILSARSVAHMVGAQLPQDVHGATNLLLLGQGDKNHDGIDLTDTVILASIEPKTSKSAVLVSLPRDLYFLKTQTLGAGRLNTLYRDRKITLVRSGLAEQDASLQAMTDLQEELSSTFGIQLHGAIKVDFTALTEIVDALGGIDITVPQSIHDPEYPNESYGYETFTLSAGPQHLDGATALKYARSRHTTSDFSRSARQQQLLKAMVEQAKAKNVITDATFLGSALATLSKHVETSFSLPQLLALGTLAKDVHMDRVWTMQLSDRNGLYESITEAGGFLYTPPRDQFDGASVLLPVSLPEFPVTWKQPHALFTLLQEHRDLLFAPPTVNILNAGAKSGLARALGNELIRYGFIVGNIDNADMEEDLPFSSITSREGSKSAAATLGTLMGLPVADTPKELPLTQQGDITILLGEDYRFTPLQHTLSSPRDA